MKKLENRKRTIQEEFWSSDFGRKYTDRSGYSPKAWDEFFLREYGVSNWAISKDFLSGIKIGNILEVGCNLCNNLRLLQKHGYRNLYGIDIQRYAIKRAKQLTDDINLVEGSIFDLPFKDNYFDLVFTAGVLIHISPKDISAAMKEIYRVSKKYIWGMEYWSEDYKSVKYRGNKNRLWKGDFAKMYMDLFPNLTLVKQRKLKYLYNDNEDAVFLLKKK
jgi:pseudaminic acid biosynthesis-associated methylase